MKRENLAKVVNDSSRKVTIRGKQAIVPLKFDENGEVATESTRIFKRLTLNDLRFLNAWRSSDWDVSKAVSASGISPEKAERLIKKLSCFREEDARVKAIAEIPTASWIKSKHVENFYDGGTLPDSAHKSLAELAKIEGAYKNTSSVNVNVTHSLQLPSLSPEDESKLRVLGDSIATTATENAA